MTFEQQHVDHSFIHLILHGHRGRPGPIDQPAHNKLAAFSNEAHDRAEVVGLVPASDAKHLYLIKFLRCVFEKCLVK